MLRLLCITAHPDDEVANFGGTLLHYKQRGVETYVVCLTPGQAATHRGVARSDQELSTVRRAEFAAAAKMLQLTRAEVLDFRDGALVREDLTEVVGRLVQRMREFRPHVVMTFGPEGALTAHLDHSMTSVFASLAFQWAGRTNRYPEQLQNGLEPHRAAKLYYASALFSLPDRQPVAFAPVTAVINVADHMETKMAAFRAHASQSPLFPIFEHAVRERGPWELFHLAASTMPGKAEEEHDLFVGIEDGEPG